MNIAIVAATGKCGTAILKEALSRGHNVLAVVRNKSRLISDDIKALEIDLFNIKKENFDGFEVVINCFGEFQEGKTELHQTALKHLSDVLSGTDKRLLVVGGAGSLFVDKTHKMRVMDTPDFPDIFKPVASSMAQGLYALQKRNDVKWTYLSPSANFVHDGKRTGKYRAGEEELLVNANGESMISYSDYAIAMIDEAERGAHIQKRFTVVSE